MAIFKVFELNGQRAMIVRAFCLSCARNIAVKESPAEEVMLWRDPSMSRVELIRDAAQRGYMVEGKNRLIERIA